MERALAPGLLSTLQKPPKNAGNIQKNTDERQRLSVLSFLKEGWVDLLTVPFRSYGNGVTWQNPPLFGRKRHNINSWKLKPGIKRKKSYVRTKSCKN